MGGFIPVLLIIIFVVIRFSKELSKVNNNRPGTGTPPVGPNEAGGARDIFDFLEELKRQNQTPEPRAEVSSAYDEQAALRERIRTAARLNREMKTRILEEPPPIDQRVAKPKPVVAQPVHDAYSVVNTVAQDEKDAEQTRGGLDHPVFAGSLYDPMAMAKRAIVLREVMGSPLGLR